MTPVSFRYRRGLLLAVLSAAFLTASCAGTGDRTKNAAKDVTPEQQVVKPWHAPPGTPPEGRIYIKSLSAISENDKPVMKKRRLSLSRIAAKDIKRIDLHEVDFFCLGGIREIFDSVQGVKVLGRVCEEEDFMAFAYFFNDEPFFVAVMGINDERDDLSAVAGFGAFDEKGVFLPVKLTERPRLPGWAFDSGGKLLKNIYNGS